MSILPSRSIDLLDERLDLVDAGHVYLAEERPAPQRRQLRGGALAVFLQQIADRHVGAGLGQRQRHLPPQPARPAGDDRHLAGRG